MTSVSEPACRVVRDSTHSDGNLRERWEAHANEWIAWARAAGHDSYWRFHRDQFLQIVPPPGHRTVDIGCGEGRLSRHLKQLGHVVVGVDASPSLVAAARELDPSMDIRLADAAVLPLDDASADLVIAFMSLQDVDAMPAAIREIGRILQPGGRLCFAIVHPINSRDGLTMTFHSQHRPLESYVLALEEAGMLIEALREPRVPDHAIKSDRSRRWQ